MKASHAALAALTLAAATVLPAQTASASTILLGRESANECAYISISYTVQAEGSSFRISYDAFNQWRQNTTCGSEANPYDGVLQWKGIRNGASFGWSAAPGGYSDNPRYSGSGYRDVRFRACNWNTGSGTVGTCGSS